VENFPSEILPEERQRRSAHQSGSDGTFNPDWTIQILPLGNLMTGAPAVNL
jgi:hypothetical protein